MSIAPPAGLASPGTRRPAGDRAAFFATKGVGPTILCIPGGYHGAWCFAAWMAIFTEAGIAAAALETRGKGSLATAAEPATGIEDYATDAVAAAMALGGPVVLLGHSLGALIAMRAAMRLPRVAGLLLVAPSPPGNMPGVAAVPTVPEGALIPPPAEALAVTRFLGGERPAGLAGYLAALSPESPRALNDRYALRVLVDPARFATIPSLVVEAGRDDAERHPAGQDAAISRFLGGEHLLLTAMPHCMMLGPWAVESAAPLIAWHRARFARGEER
ncbi:alpha/beta hydrolase [Neoroseomonas lacus]|uniref:Alpha/beta hydrolase n=1 Tax=Neoroseomonas lacus TaxID=287609 RepID=A0A917K8A8_9PROT|nr:alpha/beta hydrolase [Neoroseomonas lacus]GGJ03607.1 alpha/beta hydrolase [Neoroseomonas lacus]